MSLESLPVEIQFCLSSYLSVKDRISLSQVSTELRIIHKESTFQKCIIIPGISPYDSFFNSIYLATDPRCRIINFSMIQNPEKYSTWFSPASVKNLLMPIELRGDAAQKATNSLFSNFPGVHQVLYYPSKKPDNSVTLINNASIHYNNNDFDDSLFYGFGVVDKEGNMVFCDDSLGVTSGTDTRSIFLDNVPESLNLNLMIDNTLELFAFSSLTFVSSLNIHLRKPSTSRNNRSSEISSEIELLSSCNFSHCVNLRKFALNGLTEDPGYQFYENLYSQLSTLSKLEHIAITHFMSRTGTFVLTEKLGHGTQTIKTSSIILQPPANTRILLEKMTQTPDFSNHAKPLHNITHMAIKVPSQYGVLGVRWIFDTYTFPRLSSMEINVSQSQQIVQYLEETEALVNRYYHTCPSSSDFTLLDDNFNNSMSSQHSKSNYFYNDTKYLSFIYESSHNFSLNSNHIPSSPTSTLVKSFVSFGNNLSKIQEDNFSLPSTVALGSFSQDCNHIPKLNIRERCFKTLEQFGVQPSFSNVIAASGKILQDIRNIESLSCLPSFFSSAYSFGAQPMFTNIKTLGLDSFELLVTENKPAFALPYFSESKVYDSTIARFFKSIFEVESLLDIVYGFICAATSTYDLSEIMLSSMLNNIKVKLVSLFPDAENWNIPLDRLIGLLVPSCFSAPSDHDLLKNWDFSKKVQNYNDSGNGYFAYYAPYSPKKSQPPYTGILYAYKYMANAYEAIIRLLPNLEHLEVRNAYNATPLPQLGYLVHTHSKLKSILVTQYTKCFLSEWMTPFQSYMYPVILPGSPRTSVFIDVEGSRNKYSVKLVNDEKLRYDGLKKHDKAVENEIMERRTHGDFWHKPKQEIFYAEKFSYGVSSC
ncbi:uncharacterized protein SAPINGB_P001864 [Magnusiomyces paraingens]|uniref:F-box domain-containing protein n=1 Tax=Magnusiomyces paraingens TaxID=2606893 RepID=A0A5E8BBL6_9ASCO|nr:uncharacterized protein SAPINGB_P001864 [Saprochaete ingens]VVT48611.1 unnamed protein product [Saprochaete ingens]